MNKNKSYILYGYVVSESELHFGASIMGTTVKRAIGKGKIPTLKVQYRTEYTNSEGKAVEGDFFDYIDVIEYSDEELIKAFNEGNSIGYCSFQRATKDEDGKQVCVYYMKVYVDKKSGKVKRCNLVFVVEKVAVDIRDCTTDIFADMV